MAGQPAVANVFLSFLPHKHDILGLARDVDAASMNPGFFTPTGAKRDDPGLQTILNRRILAHPTLATKFRSLRFALVDLSGSKLDNPKFAGHRETEQGGLGSMAKLACMYTAFQLKFDLEQLSRSAGLTTKQDLFSAARKIWSDTQKRDAAKKTTIFPAGPKIELFGNLVLVDGKPFSMPPSFGAPDLEQVFDIFPGSGRGVTLRFKGSDRILVDTAVPGPPPSITDEVRQYHARFPNGNLKEVRKLSFAERLFLMVDESDNSATHTNMENLSFLYMISALWQSDLYRPERGGGLWEGSTHDGAFRFQKPPVPKNNPRADFVSATTASVAAMLTLIEQDRLVSPNSCAGMKALTNKRKPGFEIGSFTRSFFEEGLSDKSLRIERIHSKLGIADFLNDGAIIVRNVRHATDPAITKQIRYVAVACDATTVPALKELIVELDTCIKENNGLI